MTGRPQERYSTAIRADVALMLAAHRAFGLRGGARALGVNYETLRRKLIEIRQTWSPL